MIAVNKNIKEQIKKLFGRIDVLLNQFTRPSGEKITLDVLQILLPSTKEFNEIAIYTVYGDSNNSDTYDKFINEFLGFNSSDNSIKRTLYFQIEEQPFKSCTTGTTFNLGDPKLIDYNNVLVKDSLYHINNSDRVKHGQPRLLTKYWQIWEETFKKHYSGYTTLWISRKIEVGDKDFTCHAFLMINGRIELVNENNYHGIMQAIKFVTQIFTNQVAVVHSIEVEKEAKRAAIVQYMARNLSHNTGSHLIPEAIEYFKQYLNGSENFRSNQLKEEFAYYQKYTQERMELLAQLSSMRNNHNWTNYSLKEIVEEFANSIIPKGLCDNLYNPTKQINITLGGTDNFFIALPDGAIGKQAFYVILENFIRNAYKHSAPTENDGSKQYTFELKVSEPSNPGMEEFWCIDIYDKLGSANSEKRTSNKLDEIKRLICDSVLNKGQLRESGWGLLEMKSAAAFLQGYKLELLDEFNSECFQANYYDKDGNIKADLSEKNFGHRFYISKPKLLILDEDLATDEQKSSKTALKAKGISISKIEDKVKKTPHLFIISQKQLAFHNQKVLKENIDTNMCLASIENTLWEKYIAENNLNDIQIVANGNADNSTKIAYFDSHGTTLSFSGSTLKQANKQKIDELGLFYYHPYKSRSKVGELIKNVTEPRFKGLLLESVCSKGLIIDERIQNAAKAMDNDQDLLSVKDIFSLIGVDIPDLDLSGYLENPDKNTGDQILGLIKNDKYKYVVLHLTILEKLSGKSKNHELKAFIDDNTSGIGEKENFEAKSRAFILVSGRGQPPNLPSDTYYINYTTLYDCLMYRMSKPHLIQTLITLRK